MSRKHVVYALLYITCIYVNLSDSNHSKCHSVSYYIYMKDFSADNNQYKGDIVMLNGIQEGHVRKVKVSQSQTVTLKTLSMKPVVFEVSDFLTHEESQYLIELAKKRGLHESETQASHTKSRFMLMDTNNDRQLNLDEMRLTIQNSYDVYLDHQDIKTMYEILKLDKNEDDIIVPDEIQFIKPNTMGDYLNDLTETHPEKKSRHSKQTWLNPKFNDSIFQSIQDRIMKLTQLSSVFIKNSLFQIVNYGANGHYNAHTDSFQVDPRIPCCVTSKQGQCRICRFMTILFYLNDVEEGGGTAFPAANNPSFQLEDFIYSGGHDLYRNCDKASLVVQPKTGKAVMWYNHSINITTDWVGPLDPLTWHGGCPVKIGEKWIANFWIQFSDNKTQFLNQK